MKSQNKTKNKFSLTVCAGLMLPVIVTACTNGSNKSSTTSTTPQQYAYLINQGESNILIYSKSESGNLTPLAVQESIATGSDPKNGTLNMIGTESAGTDPFQVVLDKSGHHAYIANYFSNNISII